MQRLIWGTIVYSTLDNLTLFMVLSHFQFILIMPNSLFIDWIVLDLLRLYVWLYFSFVFFSSVPPLGPQGGNTAAWPTLTSSLKKRNVLLGLSCFELWLWTIHYGAFAVYLCFIYASLNNVLKTDYESVMLCFWKGCCCNTYLTLWNKSLLFFRCLQICVLISVLYICDLYL